MTSKKIVVPLLLLITDFVSDDSKKSGLGEFKDIYIAWIAFGGVVSPILIASVTKIILKKMSSSNQNEDKSEEISNTPSFYEEGQSSDSSNPKKSKRNSSSPKNKRGRKYKHRTTRKSKISRGFSRREKGSSCSDALPTVKQDKKTNGKPARLQNSADKYQISPSPQTSSEVPESITNTVTGDNVKLQIGREPVTQTQSKELESHNVERSQASDCQGHKDSDTGVPEDDHTE